MHLGFSLAWGRLFVRLCSTLRRRRDQGLGTDDLRIFNLMTRMVCQNVIILLRNHDWRLVGRHHTMSLAWGGLLKIVQNTSVWAWSTDYNESSSDVLLYEGRCFARLRERFVFTYFKIADKNPEFFDALKWNSYQVVLYTSVSAKSQIVEQTFSDVLTHEAWFLRGCESHMGIYGWRLSGWCRKMSKRHEGDFLPHHTDHFGVSVVYLGKTFSDALSREGKLSARV